MQAVEALGQVDEVYRAPVALFYLEDCSYQEIADILEVPIGTVKSRMARGLAQLKHIFAGSNPARNQPRGQGE
jgi:RNA polymerase sigma factor (sigma-70 family)